MGTEPQPQQDGGRFIGRGTYGCVFYPHLRCTRPKGLRKKEAIGKVFVDARDFKDEATINKIIDKVDPERQFTLPNYGACITSPSQAKPSDEIKSCSNITRRQNKNAQVYQILYQFGGPDLIKMNAKNKMKLDDVLPLFLPILKGVQRMHAHGYSHFDIKPENMLYETAKNRLVLIDFGLLTNLSKLFDSDSMISASYPYYPPEMKLYYAMKTKMPKSKWLEFLRSSYTRYSNVFEYLESFDSGTSHIEKLIGRATRVGETSFMNECRTKFAEKVDVFSIGMTLMELCTYMENKTKDYAFVNGFILKVILPMVDFDAYNRITMKDAISQFEEFVGGYPSIKAHDISGSNVTKSTKKHDARQ